MPRKIPKSPGRPKGSKNKVTLLREIVDNECQAALVDDVVPIVQKVSEQAKKGDMKAAKLILDRVWPVIKATDGSQKNIAGGITINISQTEGHTLIEGEVVEDES